MTRISRIALACCLALLSAAAFARQPSSADVWNGAEIDWRDVRSGIYESSQTGKPVIMVFHATWCGYCKQYRKVFKDRGVVEAARDFVMILVDVDQERTTNGAFSPDGTYVPRTIFMDNQGEVLAKYHGKTDPEHPHTIDTANPAELRELMNRARADFATGKKPEGNAPDKT